MEFQNYLEDHIRFILILSFYFLPAIVGAALTTYVKYSEKCDKSKKCTTRTILLMIFSALVPAIILSSVNGYLSEIIQVSSLRIGIAFIFGCVGDETIEIITSLRNMTKILKVLSKHIERLKKVSNVAGEVIDAINTEMDNDKDDKSDPPPPTFPSGMDDFFK